MPARPPKLALVAPEMWKLVEQRHAPCSQEARRWHAAVAAAAAQGRGMDAACAAPERATRARVWLRANFGFWASVEVVSHLILVSEALTKCEHLMSDLVNQMFDALNYTHKHTTSRVLMINQHEPLPPAHCIPEDLPRAGFRPDSRNRNRNPTPGGRGTRGTRGTREVGPKLAEPEPEP